MGDCYQANAKEIMYNDKLKGAVLIHGIALLSTDGKPFGHCWIEKGGAILDFSNGKKIATTKKKYYELGGIPVSGYKNHFYTPAEAAKKMVETGHWGPWDSKPPR